MPEQYFTFNEFDAQLAGQALGSEPRITRDVAHGDGQAFDVHDAVLEVYPDAGVTRATTPDAQVELFRVPHYTVREQRSSSSKVMKATGPDCRYEPTARWRSIPSSAVQNRPRQTKRQQADVRTPSLPPSRRRALHAPLRLRSLARLFRRCSSVGG
jgi:hypothetical protein